MSRYFALIPAAGLGARFGGEMPKQYLPLHGRPLLWHAAAALAQHPRIERVFVVLHPDDSRFVREPWHELGAIEGLRAGGSARAETVHNGLRAMSGVAQNDWVLVHDAARPCLTKGMIDRLIEEVGDDAAGGLLAVPLADTLKRADANACVIATEPREDRWRAQTPQMFRYGVLVRAYAAPDASSATDESSVVERLAARGGCGMPRLVTGSRANLKITWPEDFALAAAILGAQAEAKGTR
jgi:2-C-methyl-D-erythritol 4-phosphate cytidylyltransferase